LKKTIRMGIIAAACMVLLALGGEAVYADAVTYTFTGTADLAGTDFTFQSTTGYITTSNTYVITPTSATDLWDSAVNAGPLNQITLTTSTGSAVLTLQSPFVTVTENSNSLTTNGTSITGIGFPDGVITSVAAPEISPQSALTPLALVGCAVLIIRGRRRTHSHDERLASGA
jgi:hypothetical protein